MLLLVLADLFTRTGRFRGAAIGIAAGIKLTPLIFVPYLLFTRRFRAAVTATMSFAGTVLVGFLLLPKDSARYWFGAVADVGRVTMGDDVPFFNSSIRGLLVRLNVPHLTVTYLVLGGLVSVLGLALSVWASRRGRELISVMSCGITGLLVSPVSWIFHWVWIAPLLTMWTARAWRGNLTGEKFGIAAVWLACVTSCYWVILQLLQVPAPEAMTGIFANLYLVIGAGTLIAFAVFLRRTAGTFARPQDLSQHGLR